MLTLESKKTDLTTEIESEKLNIPIPLDRDKLLFWFEQFKDGDINDEAFRERLVDTFIHKVILFDDKIIIVYNISNGNNENITVEEILNDFNDSTVFGYDCVGDPDQSISEHKVTPNYWAFAMKIKYEAQSATRNQNGRFAKVQ